MSIVWHSWNEFAAMGGYGPYVWGSLGVVAAGLAIEVLALRARRRAAGRAIALAAVARRHAGERA
jgi:heme exporter protein D